MYLCIQDGEALGGSRKGIIDPIEIKAQPEGLGLGAGTKKIKLQRTTEKSQRTTYIRTSLKVSLLFT